MKRAWIFFACLGMAGAGLVLTGCSRAGAMPFPLVEARRPAAAFLLPEPVPDGVRQAVDEFNADLERCTGVSLPVLSQPNPELGRVVFQLESAGLLADDRFELAFPDVRTLRITASPRSVKWALNHILETGAGVRWLFPGPAGTHWPDRADVAVPRRAEAREAAFGLQRNLSYPIANWQINLNAKDELRFNHELTVFAFPLDKYGPTQSWPVDIMPVIKGQKKTTVDPKHARGGWQPCYSHPRTAAVAVENICAYLEAHPGARSVSLAVNDGGGFCECEACRAAAGDPKRNSLNQPHYSEVYYAWANRVAESVSRRHPDVYFGCLAYREVMDPPAFDLHPRLVPFLCFDTYSCLDPQVRSNRLEIARRWQERTPSGHWGHWDYSYSRPRLLLPRLYFKLQQDLMRQTHERGARAMFVEAYPNASDGPAKYLYLKLMWDVNADIEALLDDWCAACLGDKAAPYLKRYFLDWEALWTGEAMTGTPWFAESKGGIYMQFGPADYLLALQPGDLARFRKLLEQAAGLASTPAQRERAAVLMREFEFFELSAKAYNAEQICPHGSLDSEAQAVALVRALPDALAAAERRRVLLETAPGFDFNRARAHLDFRDFIGEKLNLPAVFIDRPAVREAIAALSRDGGAPDWLRTQAAWMLRVTAGEPIDNLLPGPEGGVLFGGRPAADVAFRGAPASEHRLRSDRAVLSHRVAVQPETTYLFSTRLRLPESAPAGRVEVWLVPHDSRAGRDRRYKAAPYPSFRLVPGQWTLVCSTLATPPETDTLIIYLVHRGLDGHPIHLADGKLAAIAGAPKPQPPGAL